MALLETLQKLLPAQKLGTNETTDTANEKWLQALGLLFRACEPLTHDCLLTADEVKDRSQNIERHTFYCLHVKMAIEDGVEPLSWDEWSEKEKSFNVEAQMFPARRPKGVKPTDGRRLAVKELDSIDMQQFSNDLTDMFGGNYPNKTPRSKRVSPRPEPLGDDVRFTAKYGRRDEDDPK